MIGVRDAMGGSLRQTPTHVGKSRIKRLGGRGETLGSRGPWS